MFLIFPYYPFYIYMVCSDTHFSIPYVWPFVILVFVSLGRDLLILLIFGVTSFNFIDFLVFNSIDFSSLIYYVLPPVR